MDPKMRIIRAIQDFGIASVLFKNAIGRKLNLNITDIGCVNFLFIKGHSTPTEISRYTGLTSGATTAMLDRLEKANLIIRKSNPNDRRGVLIEIDQRSRETIEPLVRGTQNEQGRLFEQYSAEELTLIGEFLIRFTETVQKQIASIEDN